LFYITNKKAKLKIPKQYRFIISLGKALHSYGLPSYKIQNYLTAVAADKGIRGSFMDSPTWVNYVFYEDENEETYNYIECVAPGELNLGAMSKVVELTDEVIASNISYEDAKVRLRMIYIESKYVNHLLMGLAFAFSAGSFSLLLGTSWVSTFVSTLMGAVVYFITFLSSKFSFVKNTLEALASLVVTILIGLISLFVDGVNIPLTILSAIIVFIPGLALTTAIEEVTYRSLTSGSAKFFDALLSLFKQFLGAVLGLSFLELLVDMNYQPVVNDIPSWISYLGIPFLSLCLLPVFQVRRKDMICCVLICIISYASTVLTSFAGVLISSFLGSLIVVICSNIFSYITKSPRYVFITMGIIVLVPGSKAFLGISSVLLNSPVSDVGNMGSQVAYILMGIIGGLIFSGSLNTK